MFEKQTLVGQLVEIGRDDRKAIAAAHIKKLVVWCGVVVMVV